MQAVKIILIGIGAIVALLLIAAIFISKDFNLEREVVINKPKQEVFNYIKYIKNQDNFSKWQLMDPGMEKVYEGTDGAPGFMYKWKSSNKEVGQGEQSIVKITEGERIDILLHFIKPMNSKADSYMITEEMGPNQTKVKWGFRSKMSYPFNAIKLFMNMEKAVGDDFSTGLTNLKTLMEKQ